MNVNSAFMRKNDIGREGNAEANWEEARAKRHFVPGQRVGVEAADAYVPGAFRWWTTVTPGVH